MRYSGLIENNLRTLWNAASEGEKAAGLAWYRTAHNETLALANEVGLPHATVVGMVAALSPGLRWEKNIGEARRVNVALQAGLPVPSVGVYGRANQAKAEAIYHGADPLSVLGGFKVRAFYQNIYTPDQTTEITVDRHAYCAAVNRRKDRDFQHAAINGRAYPKLDKPRPYRHISRHYKVLAAKLGILAHELQAVIWLVWRRIVNGAEVQAAG